MGVDRTADRPRVPLKDATIVGASVTAVFAGFSLSGGVRIGEGIAAALSNGLVVFFIMVAVGALNDAERSVVWVACAAAAGTLVTVLSVRLVAVAAGAEGPFGSVADTVLDVVARALAVFVVVVVAWRWSKPSTIADPSD